MHSELAFEGLQSYLAHPGAKQKPTFETFPAAKKNHGRSLRQTKPMAYVYLLHSQRKMHVPGPLFAAAGSLSKRPWLQSRSSSASFPSLVSAFKLSVRALAALKCACVCPVTQKLAGRLLCPWPMQLFRTIIVSSYRRRRETRRPPQIRPNCLLQGCRLTNALASAGAICMLRTLAASGLSNSESYVLHPSTKRPHKKAFQAKTVEQKTRNLVTSEA